MSEIKSLLLRSIFHAAYSNIHLNHCRWRNLIYILFLFNFFFIEFYITFELIVKLIEVDKKKKQEASKPLLNYRYSNVLWLSFKSQLFWKNMIQKILFLALNS